MGVLRKVFGNLALDFSLLLVLAALVTIFSLAGLKQVDANYQVLVNHSVEIERLAAKIKTDLLEAIRLEDTFMLNLENDGFEAAYERYVIKHQAYTDSLENDLSELTGLVSASESLGDTQIASDIAAMSEAVSVYEEHYASLIALMEERGTTQSGLEGEFRAKAAEIAGMVEIHEGKLSLQMTLLELRFFESNYLVHRSPETAERVNHHYYKFFGEVEDAAIPRRQKTQIEYLLDIYDDDFMRVVRIDEKIVTLEDKIDELVSNIIALADDIDATGRSEAIVQMNQARQVADQTSQLVVMSIAVILIFGFGLAFAMAYQLKSVKTATDIAPRPADFEGRGAI